MKINIRSSFLPEAISLFVIGVMILSACSRMSSTVASTSEPTILETNSLIQTQDPTQTPESTITPEPTKAESNALIALNNLPEEIKSQVDHIETLEDGRLVAIAKITEEPEVYSDHMVYPTPYVNKWQGCSSIDLTVDQYSAGDTEAKLILRKLQWDGTKWIDYVPQVGKLSPDASDWDRVTIDDLPVSELQARMDQQPWTGKDDQIIKYGLVAEFVDYAVFSGVIVEYDLQNADGAITNTNLVIAVPLPTGDIELIYSKGFSPTDTGVSPTLVFKTQSIDPRYLALIKKKVKNQGLYCLEQTYKRILNLGPLYQYYTDLANENKYSNIIFTVIKDDSSTGHALPIKAHREFIDRFISGKIYDSDGVDVFLGNAVALPQSEFEKINNTFIH
jgi:hypothetical protein